jgi:hypothetical protein
MAIRHFAIAAALVVAGLSGAASAQDHNRGNNRGGHHNVNYGGHHGGGWGHGGGHGYRGGYRHGGRGRHCGWFGGHRHRQWRCR